MKAHQFSVKCESLADRRTLTVLRALNQNPISHMKIPIATATALNTSPTDMPSIPRKPLGMCFGAYIPNATKVFTV